MRNVAAYVLLVPAIEQAVTGSIYATSVAYARMAVCSIHTIRYILGVHAILDEALQPKRWHDLTSSRSWNRHMRQRETTRLMRV